MSACDFLTIAEVERLIVDNLHRIRALPWDVIVHIPRSGTAPAAIIASYMARPFCSVAEYCEGMGSSRKSETGITERVLLVDDLSRRGVQMRNAVNAIWAKRPGAQIVTLSIYRSKNLRGQSLERVPDMVLREIEHEFYVAPWFLWKNKRLLPVMATDMDGVLCKDYARGEDYGAFLEGVQPKFKPFDVPVGWIVTGRREKYREQTEEWLARHGFKFGKLLMFPDNHSRKHVAEWKARRYAKLRKARLFVESCDKQAPIIARDSGKPVWCVDSSRGYNGNRI